VRPSKERLAVGLTCIFLLGLVWVVFGQTLNHGFVNYDDGQYVYENPRITAGLSLDGIGWAFTHVHAYNWHPLTTISHMLDCQLYDLHPWGHHLSNVLLHAVGTVFLFLALRELTQARWPSAFVAAVFAIHPLHVSSVAWISERKDVISGIFFMLTLWTYARYARNRRRLWVSYVFALVFFAVGLMCKPTLVTLPFVLLLLDYWPLERFGGGSGKAKRKILYLVIEKIPFFLLSFVLCVVTVLAQNVVASPVPLGTRVSNALVSYIVYTGQMFWPLDLAVVYPYPIHGLSVALTIVVLLLLIVISMLVFLWRREFPFLLVGWLWFLGVLVPMIGLIQVGVQARADRYTYLAEIGLYVLVTWGAIELLSRWRYGRETSIVAMVLIITALTAESYSETRYWRNSESLWRHALAKTGDNYIAENNLGTILISEGKAEEAMERFREVLRINPDFSDAHYNLGLLLLDEGRPNEAVPQFREVLRLNPNDEEARAQLQRLGVAK